MDARVSKLILLVVGGAIGLLGGLVMHRFVFFGAQYEYTFLDSINEKYTGVETHKHVLVRADSLTGRVWVWNESWLNSPKSGVKNGGQWLELKNHPLSDVKPAAP